MSTNRIRRDITRRTLGPDVVEIYRHDRGVNEKVRWLRLPLGYPLDDPRAVVLSAEARRRQMTPLELVTALIDSTVDGGLFGALLDR